jgi:hypothetical protein
MGSKRAYRPHWRSCFTRSPFTKSAKTAHHQASPAHAPAGSRTWIYRLGGGSGAILGFRVSSRFSVSVQSLAVQASSGTGSPRACAAMASVR